MLHPVKASPVVTRPVRHRLFIDGKTAGHLTAELPAAVKRGRREIDKRHSDAALSPRLIALIGVQHNGQGLIEGDSFAVGDVAWVHAQGRWRRGLVTKVARVRVTVSYTTLSSDGRAFHKAGPPAALRRESGNADEHVTAPVRADEPSATAPGPFHMRVQNGGTAERIRSCDANAEIDGAKTSEETRVECVTASGSTAEIQYLDGRGLVEFRPATAEEAAAPEVRVDRLYARGIKVIVRRVSWDPFSKTNTVQPEFEGRVVSYTRNGKYRVEELVHHTTCDSPVRELRPVPGAARLPLGLQSGAHAVAGGATLQSRAEVADTERVDFENLTVNDVIAPGRGDERVCGPPAI
ncbi:hypothetical protein ACFXKF_32835 [Streptomyces scopuliridis]|uniref:hypothetical protein n=1 Tax=Streptomyces scopuliridis TaxID=452529 RepID=UPI00369A17FE